jgi:Tol biopolymer transport system component
MRANTHLTNRSRYLILIVLILTLANAASAQKFSDWSTPTNLGPIINSTFNDQQAAISKDGLSLYFTSNRPGGLGGFDLYVSQRASVDEVWGSPVNLGMSVNSASNEGNPAFSRDEHFMFFQSDRTGGFGGIDIWVCHREHTHDAFDWQPAVNLGSGVNSAAGENAPSYFENDGDGGAPQLFFASDRAGTLGGLDIYRSEGALDGSFGPPSNVGELNSSGGDSRPSVAHDGLEIFLQSNRLGTLGGADLWTATRQATTDPWSSPVNLGATVNTASGDQNPYLSSDRLTLLFTSDRPGGLGGSDLYVTTRTKLRGQ